MAMTMMPNTRRADTARHLLLTIAALAGVAAAALVLSSQVVTDFLREGPVRVAMVEGGTLRVILGVGTLAATVAAVAAFWQRVSAARLAAAGIAIAGGLFLTHALFIPAATLIAAAVATDLFARVPAESRRRFGPRRSPVIWAAGGLAAVAALGAVAWVSVWLLQPLVDEGETLNESLSFAVAGLDPAASTPLAGDGRSTMDSSVESGSAPVAAGQAAQAASVTPAPLPDTPLSADSGQGAGASVESVGEGSGTIISSDQGAGGSVEGAGEGTGTIISSGELMGVDAFHTGSGQVHLIEGPDGELILRFENYDVRNGPDLHVYLTPDAGGDVGVAGAVDLGQIKATSGSVNYTLPEGLDPSVFQSVVIYCEPFQVTFAVAGLA